MTDEALFQLWSYLSTHPLAGLTATLVAYTTADWAWRACGKHPALNPVLLAILMLTAALHLGGVTYDRYFEGAQFIHVMLGPATVALAVPLWKTLDLIRRAAVPVGVALAFGAVFAAGSSVALAWLLGGSEQTLASLAPKSVTTPVAMGVAQSLGGLPSMTAVLVILTGVVGATLGPVALDLARVSDMRARGFAIGLASHGIGTARALTVSETAGAFASLAMATNAVATAALLPIIATLLF